MIYLRKILVPTDLSEFSLAAMDYASSFGLLYGSRLYMLYVLDRSVHLPIPGEENRRENAAGSGSAEEALEGFVARHVSRDVRLRTVVRRGTPSEEIRKFAEEEGIDLIVMATHGRTGLRHIVLGSVAEKVVRQAGIPVLTVKPRPLREEIIQEEDIENELHLR